MPFQLRELRRLLFLRCLARCHQGQRVLARPQLARHLLRQPPTHLRKLFGIQKPRLSPPAPHPLCSFAFQHPSPLLLLALLLDPVLQRRPRRQQHLVR